MKPLDQYPTPETDAKSGSYNFQGTGGCVSAHFARQMERERNQARLVAQDLRHRLESIALFATVNPTKIVLPWDSSENANVDAQIPASRDSESITD